ncbi:reverse transcriptase domain-containing protein, partial [Streptomyces clavifer]|uniref:reverse transcriptase domain-containing protein n=1 Tax=Streptomyces clavifer TaxID=68188 RepID=UPI0023812C0F
RNVIFLEHIPFFSLHLDTHPIAVSYLPQFSESASPSPPLQVYVRRNEVPPLATPSPDPLPAPPTASPGNDTSSASTISLRRSSRPSVAPNRYGFPALLTSLDSPSIPTSYSQASKIAYWQDAMTEDLVALEANQTWELVPAPAGASVIGSKWIYSVKVHSDGSIDRYKARLVAQGYKQEYGI